MQVPMPEGTCLSPDLPEWTRLAIADAVVLFGRMEPEIIEISWILVDADLTQKLKLIKRSTTDKFIPALESVERPEEGLGLRRSQHALPKCGPKIASRSPSPGCGFVRIWA